MTEKDAKRVKKLIFELNAVAETRKTLLDHIWAMENHTEQMRIELLTILTKGTP